MSSAPASLPASTTSEIWSEISDKTNTLVEAARLGNTSAFLDLWNNNLGIVEQAIGTVTRDPHDREDIRQDTFLRAYVGIRTFRAEARFSTWLYTIAKNTALNSVSRSFHKYENDTVDVLDRLEENEGRPDPIKQLCSNPIALTRLNRALSYLPREMMDVFALRYYNDYDYAAIATIVDCPEGTVRSRLFRAKDMLRKLIESSSPEPIN